MPQFGIKGELDESGPDEKRIEWRIPEFSSLSNEKEASYSSPLFRFANATWHLNIYPYGDKGGEGYIALFLRKHIGTPCNVTFAFGMKRLDGTFTEMKHRTYNFKDVGFGYPRLCSRMEVLKWKSELLPSDMLTIVGNLKLSLETTENTATPMKLVEFNTLSKNFKNLLANKDFCDVTLQVKEKEFRAHQLVLIARSSVFAAMFVHDTSEKQTGIVTIPDCDPESFREFLEYLYSGTLENITSRSALHLYSTADKYDVQELKLFCVKYMIQEVTAENVCSVAILTEKYNEIKLFSAAQNIFNKNFSEIVVTSGWDSLMKDDYRLAKKLLIEMSKNKT